MKHNLLKSVIISVILLLGANSVWAAYKGSNSSFWENEGLKITFNINGTTSEKSLNYASPATTTLGEVTTSLKLTKTLINFWTNYGTSAQSSTVYWELHKENTKIGNTYERTTTIAGEYSGSNSTYTVTTETDILALTTGPGNYTIKVWAKFTSSEGNYWYNMNNNSNYSFTFTIPAKKLSVTSTGNGSVSGNQNSITTGTVYSISATANEHYEFEKWTATSGSSSISIGNTKSASTTVTFNDYKTDATVSASFTGKTYKISFNENKGNGGSNSVEVKYMSNKLESTIAPPTRTGYRFQGWGNSGGDVTVIDDKGNLLPSKGTSLIIYTDNNSRWITSSATLYAQWEPEVFKIEYKDEGGAEFSGTHAAHYPTTHTYDIAPPLKSATKTGYTFGGWFTTQDCSVDAITEVPKNRSTDITLYAKWTIKQYTLNFSGDGGTVTATAGGQPITSPATINYGTSVTLTATPSGENAFAQWVNENDVKLSTNNTYTFTLTSDKTVKAVFSKPTTVYLKPSDDWKADNAHFAIYAWGGKSDDPWVDMEKVDCEGEYYKADVPAGFSDFTFVSLKEGKGHDWSDSKQTGNLTIQSNGKNMYDVADKTMTYIYLEPKAWNNGEARFAAYFFGDNDYKWVDLTQYKDGIYTCKKPTGYTSVIFCRMNKNTTDNNFENCWNKTKDLSLMNNGDNCFWITTEVSWGCDGNGNGNDGKGADGGWYRILDDSQWKTYSTPTYTVTIKPTVLGSYKVEYNGRNYPVSHKDDVVITDVPVGSVLKVTDIQPLKSKEYTSDIIYKESTNAAYQTVSGNQITVCGNTTIDENFVSKNPHTVYLRIPSSLVWKTDNNQKLSVYNKLTESYVPTAMTQANGSYETGYTYYTATIPSSTHTIRFEYNNQYHTYDFPHVMPLGTLNCYTIHSREGETTVFNGYWSELLSNGDYRLLYVEQTVEKDANNKTIIKRRKAHPSDIIPASIISAGESKVVSLHIFKDRTYTDAVKKYDGGTPTYYESNNNPEVILQQYNSNTNTWEDKECHMVFGPLKTLPGMAMAPGRRNTQAETATLVYDDGIEKIKSDDHEYTGSGVWNFTIKKRSDSEKATIDLANVTRYTGEYYIRTDVATGGWFNYNPTNQMTRSNISMTHSNYSHYYCKWIDNAGTNVKYTIANDYGMAISDTLEADATDIWGTLITAAQRMVGDDQKLPASANVRFSWNEKSNFLHRAYLAGSGEFGNRFLVVEGKTGQIYNKAGQALTKEDNNKEPRYNLVDNEEIFSDISNWIYYADVQLVPNAELKVTAKYNNQVQYFVGQADKYNNTILAGSGSQKYLIRLLYDFKTNHLLSAYVPGGSNQVDAISTNLMLIRQDDKDPTQLVFNTADMTNIPEDRKAYGVIEFTKERLIDGLDKEGNKTVTELQKGLYWISFPFDVDLSQAISFGEYGTHWVIEEYDGARRAAEGCWLESESFWKYHWDKNITLEAGKGYVLGLDVDLIRSENLFGLSGGRPIGIYFPSKSVIDQEIVNQTDATTTLDEHICTIVRNTKNGDRRIKDSHWNVLGTPSYVNTIGNYNNFTSTIETEPKELQYYYRWLGEYNHYEPVAAGTQEFQPLYSYMVQYAGTINWNNIWNENRAIAAQKNSDNLKEHRLRLEIQQNGNKADHTFVRLQDEEVTTGFDFNHDLCKIINAGANIYSLIATDRDPIEVAANVLPINETVIPLGVVISAAGEYTFAMPDGTDGIVVELIDYETNTRTNMLLDDYTVNLGKGTFENRFALHVKPNKVVTGTENIHTSSDRQIKKYIIDGALYLIKDGAIYDAQGRCVQ